MRLLRRYLVSQMVPPFIFALSALTSLMLLNQVAQRFGGLVGKGLHWTVIAEVFLLSVPFIMAMTLPMAVLLAVLWTFSRLAADNEITAMRASGISVGQMLTPVLVAGALLAAANFVMVDQLLPRTNARLRTLFFDIARKKPTLELEEEAINEIPPSRLFLRASRISQGDGRLRDVVIYDLTDQNQPRIVYADSGRMALAANLQDLQLILHDGEIHEFDAENSQDFRLTSFRRDAILVREVSNQLERGASQTVRGDREMSTCEMNEVVLDATREAMQSRRDRTRYLRRDLRVLMGLPVLEQVPEEAAAPRPRLCRWWNELLQVLLPQTAEAQEPTQSGRPQRGFGSRFDSIQALKRSRDSLAGLRTVDSLRQARGPQVLVEEGRPEGVLPGAGSTRRVDLELSTWAEVSASMDQEMVAGRKANRYLIEIHKKWTISVAAFVFVLVGIPMALRFPRGGMGLVLGGGLGVFALFYVALTAGESLGDSGQVVPWIPMWAPNIVLALLGALGVIIVSRQMGSTRGGDLGELWEMVVGVFKRGKSK